MEQQFEHLSDAQIENYGDRTGAGPNQPGDHDQAIASHLAACAGCRTRLLHFHRARFGLMNDQVPQQTRVDCPNEDALRDLAAGLSSPDAAARLTQHAAQCDHCGPILRAYTEDFSDDLSPEDQSLLNQLNSASPSWQKKMAARMAEAFTDDPSSPSVSPVLERSARRVDGVAQPGWRAALGCATKDS